MKNNIYWIAARPVWPVCTAGAVVIASTSKRAAELVNLYKPSKPEKIGESNLSERVIVSNDGEY